MITLRHTPDTGQGWQLELKQVYDPRRLDRERRPVLIIPGYGMNSFIFGYHPNGASMEEALASAGFEVWAANLRGQGGSKRRSGPRDYGFRELALVDLPCLFQAVLAATKTRADKLDPIGASLGGTLLYAYLAHHPKDHPFGAAVSIGGPLRWARVNPLLKAVFASPWLAGAVPMAGTRALARVVLPLARRLPGLLKLYMNASIVDLSAAEKLIQTVEDPHPNLNRQIALWLKHRDLVVAGVNVTEALAAVDVPLMCILANRDGVVTREAALSAVEAIGTKDVAVLEVGDEDIWFAHADLFVSRHAQERVFTPLEQWLLGHYG
jgi:pimeloyl-ACP methyl ester carboxylesterase